MTNKYQTPQRLLTINDFSAAYRLGRTKIYDMIASGELRTVVLGGRRLIPVEAAEELLQKAAEQTPSLQPAAA